MSHKPVNFTTRPCNRLQRDFINLFVQFHQTPTAAAQQQHARRQEDGAPRCVLPLCPLTGGRSCPPVRLYIRAMSSCTDQTSNETWVGLKWATEQSVRSKFSVPWAKSLPQNDWSDACYRCSSQWMDQTEAFQMKTRFRTDCGASGEANLWDKIFFKNSNFLIWLRWLSYALMQSFSNCVSARIPRPTVSNSVAEFSNFKWL